MIDFEDRIMGYSVRDLVVVAEIMKKYAINPYDLSSAIEMYAKGYKDGQEIVKTKLEQTENGFKQSFEIGAWMRSFPKIED